MNLTDRLFVEIVPMKSGQIPHPHPVEEGRFDPELIYKVIGVYNPSETSECYFVMVNPERQIWYIPQRHLRAFALMDSDEFFLTREQAEQLKRCQRRPLEPRNGRTSLAIPGAARPPRLNGEDHPGDREPLPPDRQTQMDPTRPRSIAPPPGR